MDYLPKPDEQLKDIPNDEPPCLILDRCTDRIRGIDKQISELLTERNKLSSDIESLHVVIGKKLDRSKMLLQQPSKTQDWKDTGPYPAPQPDDYVGNA